MSSTLYHTCPTPIWLIIHPIYLSTSEPEPSPTLVERGICFRYGSQRGSPRDYREIRSWPCKKEKHSGGVVLAEALKQNTSGLRHQRPWKEICMSRAGQAGRTKACERLQGQSSGAGTLESTRGRYLMTVWQNGLWRGQGRSRQTVRAGRAIS